MHLGCFLRVVHCVYMVTMGHMCMMTGLLMIPLLIGFCRLLMMLGGFAMMLGRVLMMLCGMLMVLVNLVLVHGSLSGLLGRPKHCGIR